jgi:hypothetical protein
LRCGETEEDKMNISEMIVLDYWNGLAQGHLPELVLVLTAALVALADRYIRKMVNGFTSSHGRVFRFLTFLLVCSVGYAALAMGLAFLLKTGLTASNSAYIAPAALALVVLVALEAQRQRQA